MINRTEESSLISIVEVPVRFSEVDAMTVVWHGNYVQYLEDGRDAFGKKFDLDFLGVYYKEGFLSPVVQVKVDYKRPLKLGDVAVIETTFVKTPAAKVIFKYRIFRKSDGQLTTTAETTQVFLTKDNELSITVPPFYDEWKKKWLK
ncbi:MAG: acyl-CoA thioesterase [Cytophagaceae bacterium]